jgi:Uma2 family endonuclease
VAEYWLVDPKARSVEVYTLSRGEYALLGQYTGDEVITSRLLVGLAIPNHALYHG